MAAASKRRCGWAVDDALIVRYHDEEWGVPVHDDVRLFELLILEGAQAGLSWRTILNKRDAYRKAYTGFDPRRVARFDAKDRARLLRDPGIVRNRLKVAASVGNAKAFLEVQRQYGSFDAYLWGFVKGRPIRNQPKTLRDLPAKTELSDAISRDLKRRGFKFVGSTIVYAFLQAVGVVNDHLTTCFRAPKVRRATRVSR